MNAVGKKARKATGGGRISRHRVARARRKGRRGLSSYQTRKRRGVRGLLLAEAPGWVDAVDAVLRQANDTMTLVTAHFDKGGEAG